MRDLRIMNNFMVLGYKWDRFGLVINHSVETKVKGSSYPSHFIFEINVGKSRIRHRTTLELNFLIDSKSIEDGIIWIQSRSMSDPPLHDIDFKNQMAWSELPLNKDKERFDELWKFLRIWDRQNSTFVIKHFFTQNYAIPLPLILVILSHSHILEMSRKRVEILRNRWEIQKGLRF